MANNCQFCGNYCGKYILCRACNELKSNGEITKCDDCGAWHVTHDKCKCQKSSGIFSFIKEKIFNRFDDDYYDEEDDEEDENDDRGESTCLICKKPSNGYLFCYEHYRKYKKKTVLFSVKNAKDIELVKESYTDTYTYPCDDGHIVKSKSEKDIDNYLFIHDIPHVYEKELIIDQNTIIHPDFYLPKEDVYIEHWGYGEENIQYTRQKEFKLKYYKEHGLTLICTYEKTDARKNINSVLEMKLRTFKKGQINFEE